MNQVVITLKEEDLLALWAAIIDEDAAGALSFLKDRVAPRIPKSGSGECDSTRLNPFLLK